MFVSVQSQYGHVYDMPLELFIPFQTKTHLIYAEWHDKSGLDYIHNGDGYKFRAKRSIRLSIPHTTHLSKAMSLFPFLCRTHTFISITFIDRNVPQHNGLRFVHILLMIDIFVVVYIIIVHFLQFFCALKVMISIKTQASIGIKLLAIPEIFCSYFVKNSIWSANVWVCVGWRTDMKFSSYGWWSEMNVDLMR